MKPVFYFVLVTVAGALIWTATADWYEKRKGTALAAGLPPGNPGPTPAITS